jgi:hypothetical protein
MQECSQDARSGLSCYPIELKKLVRIMRRIIGIELSQRGLKTGTSTLENVAGATSVYCPMSTSHVANPVAVSRTFAVETI